MKKELINTIKEFQEVMQFEPSLTEAYNLENLNEKELENIVKKASLYIDWEVDVFSEDTLKTLSKLKILEEAKKKGLLKKEWEKYLNIDDNSKDKRQDASINEKQDVYTYKEDKIKKSKEKSKPPILEIMSKVYYKGIQKEEWKEKSYKILGEYGYSEDKKASIDRWLTEIYMIAKYLNLNL